MGKWNQMMKSFLEKINKHGAVWNQNHASSPHQAPMSNDSFWDPPEAENKDDDEVNSMSIIDNEINNDDAEFANASISERVLSRWKESRIVKEGKLKDLVSKLLRKLSAENTDVKAENWVDIVTDLAWKAAISLKHDAHEGHEGKAMDPFHYVKIKCIAAGSREESRLFKGLVFTKHVPHKHMITKYKNPRLLLIKGTLGSYYSSSGLSSLDSIMMSENQYSVVYDLIQNLQASEPNVILVEKSVSRDLIKRIYHLGVTLVLDMKHDRLERVARCTGSPIFTSDITSNQKLTHCESLYFETFMEEHAIVGEGVKRPSKTLMFLEGSPANSGCTILLKGSHCGELKKVKCVVQCAVEMAYHYLLETSFLMDQKAMLSTIDIENAADISSTNEQSASAVSETSEIPHHAEPDVGDSADTLHVFTSSGCDQDSSDVPEPTNESQSVSTSFAADAEAKGPAEDGGESISAMDEINRILDSESISVLISRRNIVKGTLCKQSHSTHIKFYRDFDVPLGMFLRDNLYDQSLKCRACRELPEAHCYYYHCDGKQLTIRVKRLSKKHLPRESEGKLWMWSRCCKCELEKGSATKRVLISKAARCLSFGKFLELNFASHATLNRLSCCRHSFQEDFVHFFGYGSMVAMLQ